MLVSHTGVTATCESNRNLSDDQIERIAAKGGLIGIAYFQAAVCGVDSSSIVRAIHHVVRLAGVEHVALGSDFDGGTTMPFDTSELASVTTALLDEGYSEDAIAKIMGGNVLNFLEANLPH
jgi:microsomal dipeptidase-like Zn-dependent dipeptidase